MDFNLVIAGEAGQGLNTLNFVLSKILFKSGFHVYSTKDYESRVRGGHNFMKIRFGDTKITAPKDEQDILLALNKAAVEIHQDFVKEDGIMIYNGESYEGELREENQDKEIFSLEAALIADDIGNGRVANTVFVGVLLKLLGLDLKVAEEVLGEYFRRAEDIKGMNIDALRKGYEKAEVAKRRFEMPEVTPRDNQILINGNQAIGMGAAVAGVQFYSAYPMTPATGVMNYLAKRQNDLGIVVEQAEDEIAAIMMALGGSYSGIRSMTGSSGGGFSLMVEALGFAGIAEIPLTIVNVQRPGPATGLPTRTEQADLLFAINASQGDFPLMVIGVKDAEDAFYQTYRAVNLAEKYQMPVIILSDQFLADTEINLEAFELDTLQRYNGFISDEQAEGISDYKRYEFTEDGISPLAYPGQMTESVVLIDSDEHDEHGHIIEDAETRVAMVDKRHDKIEKLILEDLEEPEYIGPEETDYLLIGWGSTYGPLQEARELLEEDGYNVGLLTFSDVWPLPIEELEDRIDNTVSIMVENNATAQFSRLISSETGIMVNHEIVKYDGRPYTAEEIYDAIKEEVID
ncbi:2-oxoglutarate ferredoxin oxidoreductase subunit alpha [Orenia metallireducens]|jgi:2-oxoglutarate ferredoxin oxidoreductase subunit alpha|uniref:2-oxoglutarate ferredoxin oxidoreductase subunit alpha n=1 Tax=Orenia metallireducens TaxID=1413210 RepID=A0A285H3K4_9FIRM|nr:2-oxoacid:acceptor oxidoreductase subunit alpha [Orenia metallireducens]PRX29483.1 2-oxoglutarate ferredoxin oxidoreductase subunit alpha [Orenia metallireducens]SNY30153.1 2-oxoglutarate ferredoxin oxidoreductase subunit alpha [Orenia metallireducens]